MEHVEKILVHMNNIADKFPEYKKQCEKNGVPPDYGLLGIFSFGTLLLLWF